jgi:hypothetical protein
MVQVSLHCPFAAAMMSQKMVIPTANNGIFAERAHVRTRLFTLTIPTIVASRMSKNLSCNGQLTVRAFGRSLAVSVSVLSPSSPN